MNRQEMITEYSKSQWMDFLNNDYNGAILELFNDEGLEILKKYEYKQDRINYILAYSKYRDELFKNPKFLDLFLNTDLFYYYANISTLSRETCILLFEKCIEQNKKAISLFRNYNINDKFAILDNWKYPTSLLYEILKIDESKVKQRIIDNFNIDLTKLDLSSFFHDCREQTLSSKGESKKQIEIRIPSTLLTEEVEESIWNYHNIFKIRQLINDATYVTDTSHLNEFVKSKEEKLLVEYFNSQLIEPYSTLSKLYWELYNFEQNNNKLKKNYNKLYSSIENEIFKVVEQYHVLNPIFSQISSTYRKKSIEGVFELIIELNNKQVSNYFIDYFFEDFYYNVRTDIKELLIFVNNGNMKLPYDRKEAYEKLYNIDNLTKKEKLDLFYQLKTTNIMEDLYDDIALAKNLIGLKMKEKSITSASLSNYKNKELSDKYGIDIYTADIPFYGFIKTGLKSIDDSVPAGHSFSFVGDKNPEAFHYGSGTFLYDASTINPKQIVHIYPKDSFTLFRPFSFTATPSSYVYTLMNPDELLDNSMGYTEVLILEKGLEETELDKDIPRLKPIAVYCIDEITENDIKLAKDNNLPIFLAYRLNLKKEKDPQRQGIDFMNYYYFNDPNTNELQSERMTR